MSWFKADQTLAKHPKTSNLRKILKISRREAIGLLFDLFSWGLDTADKNGRLIGADMEAIAMALDCTERSGEKTVNALREAGFLEFDGTEWYIHDWYDYSGKLSERKEKDRTRKANQFRRNSATIPQEFHDTSAGIPTLDKNKKRLDKTALSSERAYTGAPAREEVKKYAEEISAPAEEADAFWDYYQATEWIIRGEVVSDWQALFRSWLRKAHRYGGKGQGAPKDHPSHTAANARWLQEFLANDDEEDPAGPM